MWEDQARRGGRTELGSSPAQQQQRDRAGGARGRQRKGEPLLAGKGAGPSAAEMQSGQSGFRNRLLSLPALGL